MSTPLLPRFAFRLLVPALALSAIALLGEPLPAPMQDDRPLLVDAERAAHDGLVLVLGEDALLEAEAAKKAARQTASRMRWFLTLPAAGRRCSTPGCAS